MSVVAIITARGGSKRIPRKNIKNFMGRPMIGYPIKAALESGIFDEVMVSTEDGEIAEVSKSLGASVPFMRSRETADDFTGTDEVVLEVLREYASRGREFSHFCLIYPCSPFIDHKMLREAWNGLLESKADSLAPVCRFESAPQRCLMDNDKGFIEYREKEFIESRTQDLQPLFYDTGTFYLASTEAFIRNRKIIAEKTIKFLVPALLTQDIDNEDDWRMAEIKYRILHEK